VGSEMCIRDSPHRFDTLVDTLRYADHYMIAADFADYCATQARVDALWGMPAEWNRTVALNIAGMAWFSSDRAIAEYAEDIWHVPV